MRPATFGFSYGTETFKLRSHFSMTLFEQFFAEDATPEIRRLLLESISELSQAEGEMMLEFTFNRFNVKLDSRAGVVRLEDELDPSELGVAEMPLPEFVKGLRGGNQTASE